MWWLRKGKGRGMSNWGLIEERNDAGGFIAYHVMPMVDLDGESVVSAAHEISCICPCKPFVEMCGDPTAKEGERTKDGKLKQWKMWLHNDADHPGSLTADEWLKRKAKAVEN